MNGSDIKLFEILIVLVVFPVTKSATIILPLLFVKYKLVLPIAKPIGFIFFRFLCPLCPEIKPGLNLTIGVYIPRNHRPH